jgi:hypothetical protein
MAVILERECKMFFFLRGITGMAKASEKGIMDGNGVAVF